MTSSDQPPRPLHVLRTLAEATARHIVALDTPPEDPGLARGSIQLLAGAYVELRDQIRAIHDLVNQDDPNDPIATALARVGLAKRPPDWQISTQLSADLRQASTEAQSRNDFVDTLPARRSASLKAIEQARSAPAPRKALGPLKENERRLAEVTARLIAKAAEIGLPDTPDKLGVSPLAIQLLARAFVELSDDPVRAIQGRIDQIVRVAIEGALREVARQQGGIATGQIVDEAKSEGMLAAKPFMTALTQAVGPRIVRTAEEITKLPEADLLAIYCRVMGDIEATFVKYESFIVRVWDGSDGCWTDCTGEVGRIEALRYWAEKTDGGTHHVSYAEMDYYRIFPGGTRMLWDGSEGGEMHR
jgi:hypothetical protein